VVVVVVEIDAKGEDRVVNVPGKERELGLVVLTEFE